MTRALAVVVKDDLDAMQGVSTVIHDPEPPARLQWKGRVVDLDLTEPHSKELDALLAPYLEAGTPVGKSVTASEALQRKRVRSPQRVAYFQGMRAYADAKGYTRDDAKKRYYIQGEGGLYHSVALRKEYDKYLADHGGEQVT